MTMRLTRTPRVWRWEVRADGRAHPVRIPPRYPVAYETAWIVYDDAATGDQREAAVTFEIDDGEVLLRDRGSVPDYVDGAAIRDQIEEEQQEMLLIYADPFNFDTLDAKEDR